MKEKILNILIRITGCEELRTNSQLDLIEDNILDSFGFISLITTLEEEFDIELQPTQLPASVWRSADSITETVEALINQ